MKEMAQKIDVPVTTYREWEYGRAIQGEPYVAISEVLEVSLYELLTGTSKDKNRVNLALLDAENALRKIRLEVMSFF